MKKIKILLALLVITQFAFAQAPVSPKTFPMGIILGTDFSHLQARSGPISNSPLEYTTLETEARLGFNLGILYRFQLNESFDIVPQAILSFQENTVDYRTQNQTIEKTTIQPLTVELPVHIVFTKDFDKKISPSVSLGARYIHDITKREGDYQQDLKHNDFAIDLGGGLEINFNKFKMKPELLYSFGTTNLRNNNNDLLDYEIGRIIRDKLSIRIVFYN